MSLLGQEEENRSNFLKSLVSHVLNLKSGIKLMYDKIRYTYCVTNEFDQLLRFKTWETRLFKMPTLVTGMRIAVASELYLDSYSA